MRKGWMEACSVVASYADSVLLWLHTLCRARLCCRQGVRLGANVPALRRAPCQRHESLTVILLAWWTERRKGEAFFFLSAICFLSLSFSFFVYVCVWTRRDALCPGVEPEWGTNTVGITEGAFRDGTHLPLQQETCQDTYAHTLTHVYCLQHHLKKRKCTNISTNTKV